MSFLESFLKEIVDFLQFSQKSADVPDVPSRHLWSYISKVSYRSWKEIAKVCIDDEVKEITFAGHPLALSPLALASFALTLVSFALARPCPASPACPRSALPHPKPSK